MRRWLRVRRAGLLLPGVAEDEPSDRELRITFDFDGVLADDESETVFKPEGLERFYEYEALHKDKVLQSGLMADLFASRRVCRSWKTG